MFGEIALSTRKVDELENSLRKELEELLEGKMPLEVVSEKEIEFFVSRGHLSKEKGDKALDLWKKIQNLMEIHGQLVQADNALYMMGF